MGRVDERLGGEAYITSCSIEEAGSTVAPPMSNSLHEAEDPEAGAHKELDAVKVHQ